MAKEKVNKEIDERMKRLKGLSALINKSQWGGENHDISAVLGDEAVVTNIVRFSTGNKAIDYAFGGGVPKGKIIELWGGESSGKSTLVYHIIANYQKAYPEEGILLLDTEVAYDPLYAENLGVNAHGLLYVPVESGIGALNIAKMAAETGGASLIVIDSIAALTTKSDDEGNIGDQQMAEQARMISQAFRVLNSLVSQHGITIVVTNQVREAVGILYGEKTTTPAGKALKHYAHIRAKMTRISQIKQGENIVGINGRLDCIKNKVAPPFRKAEYSITFGIGIDSVIGLVNMAIEKGVISKKGAWLSFNGEQVSQGVANLVEDLRKNNVLRDSIEKALNDRLDGAVIGASSLSKEEVEVAKANEEDDSKTEVESV